MRETKSLRREFGFTSHHGPLPYESRGSRERETTKADLSLVVQRKDRNTFASSCSRKIRPMRGSKPLGYKNRSFNPCISFREAVPDLLQDKFHHILWTILCQSYPTLPSWKAGRYTNEEGLCHVPTTIHCVRLCRPQHESMIDVESREPIYCTLEPNERNCDGMKICFAAGKLERAFENRGCSRHIRPCVEDSTSRKKPCVTPKWSKVYDGFRGRLIESQQVDFDLVRKWLYLCETSHASTCSRNGLISSTACKIRLIGVMNRQIVDGTTNNRYLALSYVWGPSQQFCLSKKNHGDLRASHGLKDDEIPTTIKDAFDVVARLGERYLGVDRLCILIDDEQDKLEQMSNMDRIYSVAVLTIVNASACCSNASIPGVRPDTRQLHQHSEVIRGVRFITTQQCSE